MKNTHTHTHTFSSFTLTPTLLLLLFVQCEGKEYDEKSDIWALGCILYEMACLQKTFEGSNLPALVNKIMKVSEKKKLIDCYID